MSERMDGGCACGRIRFSARIATDEAYLCHCRMCQRATGSVSIAFTSVDKEALWWEGEPDWYQSSPIARRPYCRTCGTSLGFDYPDSDRIDVTVASFDNPFRFRPTRHFAVETMHRAWLNTEGLPESRITDNPQTVDRWMKTTGQLPA